MNVEINGFISSCKSDQCGFMYDEASTPSIVSVSPTSGTGGTTVTITCTGCESGTDKNTVSIGGVPCDVQSATTTTVTCVTGNITQPAKMQKKQCGGVYFRLYGIAY